MIPWQSKSRFNSVGPINSISIHNLRTDNTGKKTNSTTSIINSETIKKYDTRSMFLYELSVVYSESN